jgi:hypothetical protein
MKPASSDTAQTSFLLPDLEKQLDPEKGRSHIFTYLDEKTEES